MTEKFIVKDGRPLTPYEREVLTILQEEAAEVIVAASKMLRFGVANTNPTTGITNDKELGWEVGDFIAMSMMATSAGLFHEYDIQSGIARKRERLKTFLQNPKM